MIAAMAAAMAPVSAGAVYASVYGQSPLGNSDDYFGNVDKDKVTFLQRLAQDAVVKLSPRQLA
jgi:hypothetical protein